MGYGSPPQTSVNMPVPTSTMAGGPGYGQGYGAGMPTGGMGTVAYASDGRSSAPAGPNMYVGSPHSMAPPSSQQAPPPAMSSTPSYSGTPMPPAGLTSPPPSSMPMSGAPYQAPPQSIISQSHHVPPQGNAPHGAYNYGPTSVPASVGYGYGAPNTSGKDSGFWFGGARWNCR